MKRQNQNISSSQAYSAADTSIENHFPGSLFIVVTLSGAGKSALVNALLAQGSSIRPSVSATACEPHPGERRGRKYSFMTVEEFKACCDHDELLEWTEIHDNYYATSRVWIEEQMRAGTDVLLEVNWQGVQQVYQRLSDTVEIFILPPSLPTLEERLKKRDQGGPNATVRHLLAASSGMAYIPEADYVVIDEVFDTVLAELCIVVRITRLRSGARKVCRGELPVKPSIH